MQKIISSSFLKRFQFLSLVFLLAMATTGCAMFEREQEDEPKPGEPLFPPSNIEADAFLSPQERNASKAEADLRKNSTANESAVRPGSAAEQEITHLNSKVEAMETKIEVLREEMRQMRIRGSQPQMQAEAPQPKKNLPEVPKAVIDTTNIASAANNRPARIIPPAKNNSAMEKDFQAAMKLLRTGNNRDSANQFFSIAKANPNHSLASHALFWAGEAGARSRNWKVSIRHWTKVEREYPRSQYMPEVLAGLSRAYAATGNISMAKKYRDTLVKAFPDAPATLNFMSDGPNSQRKEI